MSKPEYYTGGRVFTIGSKENPVTMEFIEEIRKLFEEINSREEVMVEEYYE